MRSDQLNESIIVQYLLGELSESDAEALDEKSFTDDDFYHHLQSFENDLIDAYARGEMSPARREQFERSFLTNAKQVERVAFAKALADFRFPESTPDAPPTADAARLSALRSFLNYLRIPRMSLQLSFAAAAVVLLFGFTRMMIETSRLRSRLNQIQREQAALIRREQELQAQIAGQLTDRDRLVEDLRRVQAQRNQLQLELKGLKPVEPKFAFLTLPLGGRGGRAKDFVVPPGTKLVRLRVPFESDDFASYGVELRTQTDDRPIWSHDRLKARTQAGIKFIDLNLSAALLKPQGYLLTLKGVTTDGKSDDLPSYEFRIVEK